MVVLKFNTSDGIPLQFDIAVIDDGDVLPDKADLDRKNLEYRSLQKISKHLFIKVNQRGGMLYQLIKDVLVTFNSGLSGQVNDENKRSRPPSSASASASASPESKIQRSQSTRDVSKSQWGYRETMSNLTPNLKRKVANHMNSATVTATDTNKENETTNETETNSNQKKRAAAAVESTVPATERNNDQNEKEGTDTNKENEKKNNQTEGETAAVESTVPATERNINQNEKEGTDTNKEKRKKTIKRKEKQQQQTHCYNKVAAVLLICLNAVLVIIARWV
jgi:hypothetical protein